MRRNNFRWPALGILVGLILAPLLGHAVTFLRDDGGTVAPLCSFLDSANLPAYCSSANPLPTTAGGLQAATDPIGFGRRFNEGTGIAGTYLIGVVPEVAGMLVDSTTAIIVGPLAGGSNAMAVSQSRDGGRTFALVSTSPATAVLAIQDMIRLTDSSFMLAGMTSPGTQVGLYRTTDLIVFTQATGTAVGGSGVSLKQNGGTILATTDTTARVCRSTDNGASFTCVTPAIFGATAFTPQSLAPVTAGVWLAVNGAGVVGRSIDDGSTWTTNFSVSVTSSNAVTCVTATVCLVSDALRMFRSVDGGQTWAIVLGPLAATSPSPLAGFANFGNGVVSAVVGPPATPAADPLCYRSTDFGVTWILCAESPAVVALSPGTGITSVSTSGGSGFYVGRASATAVAPILYSTSLGAGAVQIKGDNGATWQMNALGEGLVAQGTGAFETLRIFWGVSTPSMTGFLRTQTQASGANAAQAITIAGVANQRTMLHKVTAFCTPAGTASFNMVDGATTRYIGPATSVPTAPAFLDLDFGAPFQATVGLALIVNVGTCGVGNTSQLNIVGVQQ